MFFGNGRRRQSRYGAKVKPLSPWQTWSGWKRGERPWASNYSGYEKPVHGGASLYAWLMTGVAEGRAHNHEASPWGIYGREFFNGAISKLRFEYRDGSQFVLIKLFGLTYAKQVHLPGREGASRRRPGVWWDDRDLRPISRGGGGSDPNGARKGR